MAVTLAQAQVNTQSDIDYNVIDNLRRYSWALDQIVFDDTVTPGTGGASLTYGYTRLTSPRTASFRSIGGEYTATQAVRQRYSVDLKPNGGAFTIDRVLANLGQASTNEVMFQMQQLLVASKQRWLYEMVNGDTGVDSTGFDGLNKALVGASTEYDPLTNGVTAGYLDWTAGTINTDALAMSALDRLDEMLAAVVPSTTGGGDQGVQGALPPGVKAILGNTKSITRIRSIARRAAQHTSERDSLGRQVERYGDWVLVDMGDGPLGASPIIPIYSADADGAGGGGTITGLTDVYAVTFGLDALHAAAVANKPLVQTWLPDFNTAGANKSGEVEMGPSALVIKNVKACAVLRKVKVQ